MTSYAQRHNKAKIKHVRQYNDPVLQLRKLRLRIERSHRCQIVGWAPLTGVLTLNPTIFPCPKYFPRDVRTTRWYAKRNSGGKILGNVTNCFSPSWKVIVVLDNIKAFEKPYMKETGLILLNPVFAWNLFDHVTLLPLQVNYVLWNTLWDLPVSIHYNNSFLVLALVVWWPTGGVSTNFILSMV